MPANRTTARLGMSLLILVIDITIAIFVLLLCGLMIFSQVLFVIYATILPIAWILSLIPSFNGMFRRSIEKVFNIIMLRVGYTLIITVAFSISSLLYDISEGAPFLLIAFLQILCFAGIYINPLSRGIARENGISDYVMYILAIMQVESGGRGPDILQCSESLGLPLNSLEPEASIRQGCYYFAQLLTSADSYGCDIYTAIQAYNFGGGFVSYVASSDKSYTFALAMSYASTMAGGKTVAYTNAIAVSTNGGWRYSYENMFYVKLVRQYLNSRFTWPSDAFYTVTSVYGDRIHPISGMNRHHNRIDIGAPFGANVLASAGGTDTLARYSASYGNYIIIDHGNNYKTLYAHMSQLNISVGASVFGGQVIGLVGSTGNSTGPHIHYEVLYNGSRTDPLSYFSGNLYTYRG